MLRGILADINVSGHFTRILHLLEGEYWREIWTGLRLTVHNFESLGLSLDASDREIWLICQSADVVLITANRNQQGDDSFEAILRTLNTESSLPIITIAKAGRVLRGKDYADRVAEQLLDRLLNIDTYRGAGRIFIP